MEIENSPKLAKKFYCTTCDYSCSKESDYKKHLVTAKHLKRLDGNSLDNLENKKVANEFTCQFCNKKYNTCSGLWKHNKVCSEPPIITEHTPSSESEVKILTNIVLEIVKSHSELQKQMLEVIKNGTTNINNSTNNSHNKTFNLQVFLNETCKDAMNIMDFVDSIKIQLADIESIGELGYVNGISKLIIKNLKALDEHMRPVHCSDLKRESLYVKDANVWEKEDSDNKKIKKAIKYIAHKNICALPIWKAKYPDYNNSESKRSDQYSDITIEAMGGHGDNDEEKANKIVKKIAKEVLINKN
jgi:hypothetical protein